MIATLLLMILAFSLTSNTFLVSGDAGGTGKFLTINFKSFTEDPDDTAALLASGVIVTATKVNSGEIFEFIANDPNPVPENPDSQRVGAGTVVMGASTKKSPEWEFKGFSDNVDAETGEYKTVKSGVVTAIFDRISHDVVLTVVGMGTITTGETIVSAANPETISVYHDASVHLIIEPEPGNKISTIESDPFVPINDDPQDPQYTLGPIISDNHFLTVNFVPIMYTIDVSIVSGEGAIELGGVPVVGNSVEVVWGSTPTFDFYPGVDEFGVSYHVSAILVDGDTSDAYYAELTLPDFGESKTSYTLPEVYRDYSLAVTFSLDGQADIPEGLDVTVFLSSAASLTFDDVDVGYATGDEYNTADVLFWDVRVVGDFEGKVIVAFRYNEGDIPAGVNEEDLRLYISDFDSNLYLRCDLNDDGIIDGQDVKLISQFVKHLKHQPSPDELDKYNLTEGDFVIDENDIHVVNSMKNVEWIDITYDVPGYGVDTENNIIYGVVTDHFSIFRGR